MLRPKAAYTTGVLQATTTALQVTLMRRDNDNTSEPSNIEAWMHSTTIFKKGSRYDAIAPDPMPGAQA